MLSRRIGATVCVVMLLGLGSSSVNGQGSSNPNLLPSVRIPDVTLQFDSFFDPSGGVDPTQLMPAAQNMILMHKIAQQQVELAIQFLEANREVINAGKSAEFNSIFGMVARSQPVAVLAPAQLGTGRVQAGGFSVTSSNTNTGASQATTGTSGTTGSLQVALSSQLREGDYIFVGDPASPTPPLSTRIARVQTVPTTTGQSQSSQNATDTIELDRFGAGIQDPSALQADQPVYKVIRFELQPDRTTFDRVLETFKAIRRGLSGMTPTDTTLNPFDPAAILSQQPIEYRGNFADFNTIWGAGVGEITALNGLLPTGLVADRLLRQAGLSRSDSALHIQNLADVPNVAGTLPLLWTGDNDLPLDYGTGLHQFGTVLPVGGAPIPGADRLRAFFNDRQTLFGEPNNPFVQYVGEAFLQERFLFKQNSDFFDTTIGSEEAADRVAVFETDQSGNILRDNNGNPVFTTVTMPRTARNPDVGGTMENGPFTENNPYQKTPTELKQWQMIIQSFAEHSTDFVNLNNVAAVGVMNIAGGTGSSAFRALDAANYAKFADLIRSSGAAIGAIDPARIEPMGKRAVAGFNPIVPRF